jgi:nucleoside-diphosphate-sugar epimerase
MKALVIGGTGPTGPHIVEGLKTRGYEVVLLHRGLHEDGAPADVEHIHTDPYSSDALSEALSGRHFDVALGLYGRVRAIGEAVRGHCDHLICTSGIAVYQGMGDPAATSPTGMAVLAREDAPLVDPETGKPRLAAAIRRAEDSVLALGAAGEYRVSGVRYPQVYGPRNSIPWEWPVLKRLLDGRTRMIVPDDGLWIVSRCAARNAAELVLAIVDNPDVAEGQYYNIADDEQFTVRQLGELIAEAAGRSIDFIGVPSSIGRSAFDDFVAPGGRPHALVDISKARRELGYQQVVSPLLALAETVAWLTANPVSHEQYPNYHPWLDYESEDRILDAYLAAHDQLQTSLAKKEAVVVGRGELSH